MSPRILFAALSAAVFTLLLSSQAAALPNISSASDTVDDATIRLRIMDKSLVPDATSWCQLEVDILGADVTFSTGDDVELWVYEDDSAGNDQIWYHKHTFTAAEVAANEYHATFDCSGDFEYDGFGGNLEVFAEAEVEKDDCGTFCVYDRPTTSNIDSAETEDDGFEEDDSQAAAHTTGLGINAGYAAVDQDWFTFTTTSVTRTTLDVLHYPTAGRLDVALFDDANNPVAVAMATDLGDRTQLVAEPLPAGTFYIRVTPRASTDPNFYDLGFAIDNLSTTCQPNADEMRACGDCGVEVRTCDASGSWGTWSACMNEGECQADATENRSCSDNGNDGTQERICSASCTWEDWTTCMVEPCTEGEMRACYTGTAATRGVGTCADGMQTCTAGVFGECENEVLPAAEVCDNTVDDDCDGEADTGDDDCAVASGELGDVCTADAECGDWSCLQPPDQQQFVGGYCGRQQACSGAPGECGPTGVCGQVGDAEFCLARCSSPDDCRADYTCAELDAGSACVPRCRNDSDCPGTDSHTCDLLTGLCELRDQPGLDMGGTDTSPGTDTSTPTDTSPGTDTSAATDTHTGDDSDVAERNEGITAEAGCACASVRSTRTSAPGTALGALLALGLGGLVWRRRRRAQSAR